MFSRFAMSLSFIFTSKDIFQQWHFWPSRSCGISRCLRCLSPPDDQQQSQIRRKYKEGSVIFLVSSKQLCLNKNDRQGFRLVYGSCQQNRGRGLYRAYDMIKCVFGRHEPLRYTNKRNVNITST